jgi:predicted transcriptional regulator
MTEHPVSVRLDEATVQRLDRLAEAMSKRAAGAAVKRGTALRAAVERGMEQLEAELGLAKRPKRKP